MKSVTSFNVVLKRLLSRQYWKEARSYLNGGLKCCGIPWWLLWLLMIAINVLLFVRGYLLTGVPDITINGDILYCPANTSWELVLPLVYSVLLYIIGSGFITFFIGSCQWFSWLNPGQTLLALANSLLSLLTFAPIVFLYWSQPLCGTLSDDVYYWMMWGLILILPLFINWVFAQILNGIESKQNAMKTSEEIQSMSKDGSAVQNSPTPGFYIGNWVIHALFFFLVSQLCFHGKLL